MTFLALAYILSGCVALEVTDRGHGLARNVRDASGGHPALVWLYALCWITSLMIHE